MYMFYLVASNLPVLETSFGLETYVVSVSVLNVNNWIVFVHRRILFASVFTALQLRSRSLPMSICLSVRLSVCQTREL